MQVGHYNHKGSSTVGCEKALAGLNEDGVPEPRMQTAARNGERRETGFFPWVSERTWPFRHPEFSPVNLTFTLPDL